MSVAKGSTVSITVASGPKTAEVPAVVGKSEADATSALKAKGFAVKVETQAGSGTGLVTSQDPAGNTKAEIGATVTITLDGPPAPAP